MKGIRFYLEYPSAQERRRATRKHLGNHIGTVVAVFVCNGMSPSGSYDALGGLTETPDAPVCGTGASPAYLREKCLRISEQQARQIHPTLFASLDTQP